MAKVTIFTTPTCHWCEKTKEFFKENKVKYTEVDVTKDHIKAQEMIEKSGQMNVPVIENGDEIIIGFKKARLKQLLKIQ